MTALVKYEAARAALQAAVEVDEVKNIRDKAQAMAAYATQAKDLQLMGWASEIKVRAERKAGEMLAEMPKNAGGRPAKTGSPGLPVSSDTLKDLGISKKQSATWQQVAEIPEGKFEEAVEAAKGDGLVTTAGVLRATSKPKQPTLRPLASPDKALKPDAKALTALQGKYDSLAEKNAELTDRLGDLADLAASAKAFEDKAEFKEMQILRVELRGAKRRRDELMRENAELKKQVAHWRKKAGKK